MKNKNKNKNAVDTNNLKDGQSIEKGFCPDCGEVPVLVTKYKPNTSGIALILHGLLGLLTGGFWLMVVLGWWIGGFLFNPTKKQCVKCGKKLK